jgi:hypothetical protein
MPAIVQHFAEKSYGYIDTHVDRARNMVPLLDATVKRFEPYILPTILTADKCVNVVHNAAEIQVLSLHEKQVALKGKVASLSLAATGKFQAFGLGVHTMAVDLVDRSEAVVDHLLPPDKSEEKTTERLHRSSADVSTLALIPRSLSIVCRVPVRSIKLVYVNVGGLAGVLGNKVVRLSEPGVVAVRSSGDVVSRRVAIAWQSVVDGKRAVVVWVGGRCYMVASCLQLPQIQGWTLEKIDGLMEGTGVILAKVGIRKADVARTAA